MMPMRFATISVCIAALTLMASGCDEGSPPAADAVAETHPTAPGFMQLNASFFSVSCASSACHAGPRGAAGLSFDDPVAAWHTLLESVPVNPVAASAGMGLIAPGDAERSFLRHKLVVDNTTLTIEGYGSRMPLGGAGAPGPATLAAIDAWIAAGAPLDGQPFDADFTQNEDGSLYVACDASTGDGLRRCFGEEPDPSVIRRYYSAPIELPPHTEIQLCTYLPDVTTEAVSFKSFRARQMTGGHHSALYVAFAPEEPGLRSCTGEAMTNLRILAGAFSGTDGLVPDDVRLDLPAGRQVVVQSHYINPTDETITVMDAVDLTLTTPEESPLLADSFVLNMDGFNVPPGAQAMEYGNGDGCRIGRPLALHSVQLHTHEHAVLMELYHTPADGEPTLVFSETDGILMREGAAALIFDPPFDLAPDDRLSVRCRWDNPGTEALTFPDEMCAAFMYYTPGEGFLLCDDTATEPSLLGAGDPEGGCVPEGNPGNENGVGRYCTAEGNECLDNGAANLCLGIFDARANFCSIFGCASDADCGTGAVCHQQTAGSACVPVECAD